jgi:ankyrin repeat protein
MASRNISTLPTELVIFVVENVDKLKDLSALARVDRRLYDTVNPILYRTAVARKDSWPLAWAAHVGLAGTIRKVLAAGADPDHQFYDTVLKDTWLKSIATARNTATAGDDAEISLEDDDEATWEADSEADHHAGSTKWSPERSDSDHPGTVSTHLPSNDSTQPLSNSNGSHTGTSDGMSDDIGSDVDMMSSHDGSSDVASDELEFGNTDREDMMPVPTTINRRFYPLHLAARGGHDEVIEVLLAYGASLGTVSENFCDCIPTYGLLNSAECPRESPPSLWSPLHVAICHSRSETAKLLLSRGASTFMEVPHPTSSTSTALHQAAGMGLTDLVQFIWDQKIQSEVDVQDDQSFSPFYYAYANGRWTSTVPLLIQLGANLNIDTKMFIPYTTITPLGEACRMGQFDVVDRLMDLGADLTRGFIAQSSGRGLSPLHMCCMPSAKPIAERRGPMLSNEQGDGAARMRTIRSLLARGAVLNAPCCAGDTPLMVASQNRIVPALRALVKAGADLHVRNAVGRNAVMQAVQGPPNPTVPPVYDARGIEALSQTLRELLDNGARLEDLDLDGNTVLHLVVQGNAWDAALRLLLNKPGGRQLMYVRNTAGHTPFSLAFYSQNLEACQILARHGYVHTREQRDELLQMLRHSSVNLIEQMGLADFVLDLDTEQSLVTDASLFPSLFAEGGDAALKTALVMFKRGLPPLSAEDSNRLLFQSIEYHAYGLAHHLIDAGADVDSTTADGQCLLSVVLNAHLVHPELHQELHREQFLQVLLNRGANIHFQIYRSPHPRPLTIAIRMGLEDVLSLMMEKQPLKDDLRQLGGCYLHDAVRIRAPETSALPNEKILNALLKSGASVTELDKNGDTPLSVLLGSLCAHRSFVWRYHRYIKALHGPGVDVNQMNNQKKSIADYLNELMNPSHPHDPVHTQFLHKRMELANAPGNTKEIKFLPRPQKRVRPGIVWSG